MAQLNRAQVTAYAKAAGFKGQDLSTMVAIVFAESGGNTTAHNQKGGDNSYGLAQINMLGDMGPDRRRRYGLSSNEQLYDPATNLKVAKAIKDKDGFSAWTTYTRGDYLKHMDGTTDAEDVKAPTPAGVATGVKDAIASANPISGVSRALNAAGGNLLKAGSMLAGGIVAVAFLVLGVVILMRGQIGGAVKTARKVVP